MQRKEKREPKNSRWEVTKIWGSGGVIVYGSKGGGGGVVGEVGWGGGWFNTEKLENDIPRNLSP